MPYGLGGDSLKNNGFLDMEKPIRALDCNQTEANVFLGKVGVGTVRESLKNGCFDRCNGIFLILDEEDYFDGETMEISETICASIRFHGSHAEAPEQYQKLLAYIGAHKLQIGVFSREITMIDYGFTSDTDKFVTGISIPVLHSERISNLI